MNVTRRLLVLTLAVLMASPALAQNRRTDHWVATWATALVARPQGQGGRGQGPAPTAPTQPAAGAQNPGAGAPVAPAIVPPTGGGAAAAAPPATGRGPAPQPPVTVTNQTIRQIVRTSIGGNRIRVVLSNVFGTAPLEIGAAHVALRQADATIAGAAKPLTFGGSTTGTILPGAVLLSDPVDLMVGPLTELAIDLYLPG